MTDKPWARASAITELDFPGVEDDAASSCPFSGSSSAAAAASRPMEAKEESRSPLKVEERRKVADTEVISLTESDNVGAHGRIECHSVSGNMAAGGEDNF